MNWIQNERYPKARNGNGIADGILTKGNYEIKKKENITGVTGTFFHAFATDFVLSDKT